MLPLAQPKNVTTAVETPSIKCNPSLSAVDQSIFWFKGSRLLNIAGTHLFDSSGGQGNLMDNSTRFVFNTNSSFNGTYSCYGNDMYRSFDVSYCKLLPESLLHILFSSLYRKLEKKPT